jgi:polyhydroxybutyrate depolymerase
MSEHRTVVHEGLEREYIVHVPSNINQDSPLVVVIHGFTSSAEIIMTYSDMNDIANREGFIAVYPQGTVGSDGNTFFNVGYDFHSDSTVNDVSFIRYLVNSLTQEFNLKRQKAFATGMSNGGDMAYLLACTSSDVFEAVASVTGVMMKQTMDNCMLDNPVPIFEIHGTADDISFFDGDINNSTGWGAYYSLPETIDFFVKKYQLAQKSEELILSKDEGASNDIFFERYWTEGVETEVWMYRIEGGGHIWPGAGVKLSWWNNPFLRYYFGSGDNEISASEAVWMFFKKYL